jgi:hypothetical protein
MVRRNSQMATIKSIAIATAPRDAALIDYDAFEIGFLTRNRGCVEAHMAP